MELDLNKFRTLVPINALYENNLLQLARQARVRRFSRDEKIFDIGDEDHDSLFLMSGTISLTSEDNQESSLLAGTNPASYAIATAKPRKYSARVTSATACVVFVDSLLLERLLAWGEYSAPFNQENRAAHDKGPSAADSEWMMAMLQTRAFLKLPAQNIQELFSRMEELEVRKGAEIIRFGEEGKYYYLVKSGRCQVSRPSEHGDDILAELGKGSSFGEEALISETPRNATITMLTDGKLMRLLKHDFLELLNEPILNWVKPEEIVTIAKDGAILVDVRLESEYENSGKAGAINIPLHLIRQEVEQLDPDAKYILYCDTGQRSSTAAFLMNQYGLDAYVVRGGVPGT